MDEQEYKPLEEENIHSLYPQALSSVYALVSGKKVPPEQILRLGLFFAEVSKLLGKQKTEQAEGDPACEQCHGQGCSQCNDTLYYEQEDIASQWRRDRAIDKSELGHYRVE